MSYYDYQVSQITDETEGYKLSDNYKIFTFNTKVIKIGYCCEPNGRSENYPIKIRFNSPGRPLEHIYIGPTGMYEVQKESEDSIFRIYEIHIPKNIKFTLEYVSEI